MDAETASKRFVELFPALYRRFHRRLDHSEYLLTRESLAVLRHLADTRGQLIAGVEALLDTGPKESEDE